VRDNLRSNPQAHSIEPRHCGFDRRTLGTIRINAIDRIDLSEQLGLHQRQLLCKVQWIDARQIQPALGSVGGRGRGCRQIKDARTRTHQQTGLHELGTAFATSLGRAIIGCFALCRMLSFTLRFGAQILTWRVSC
jgi:hypothetical protein